VVARATLFYGLNTFIPLYVLHVLGGSQAAGATALTVFALAGVAGNLLGGKLSDRLGYLRVTVGSFCLLVPLVPALLSASSVAWAIVVLAVLGAVLSSTYSPLVILGQRYLPNHIGLSAGVTLGIAVAIGGVATPLLGRIGDLYGLWTALAVLTAFPVASVGLALTLPAPAGR
jgi:FSR family fosmidomycin resistance protein-like MFS transporter